MMNELQRLLSEKHGLLPKHEDILADIQRELTRLVGIAEAACDPETVKILLKAKTEIFAGWSS
jgi:hypothetical protein